MSQEQQKSSVDWVKVAAGALAAMVSAVLLSRLGAAGTVIGAALGSVIVTVGNSVFSRGITVSKQGVGAAQSATLRRVSRARAQVGRVAEDMDGTTRAQHRLSAARVELDEAESELRGSGDDGSESNPDSVPQNQWRERLAALSWKRVGLAAAGLFVVAMLVITGFELVSGRAVSSYTGGSDKGTRTSVGGLGGGSSAKKSPTAKPTKTSSPSASTGQRSTRTQSPPIESATPSVAPPTLSATPSSTATLPPTQSATP